MVRCLPYGSTCTSLAPDLVVRRSYSDAGLAMPSAKAGSHQVVITSHPIELAGRWRLIVTREGDATIVVEEVSNHYDD